MKRTLRILLALVSFNLFHTAFADGPVIDAYDNLVKQFENDLSEVAALTSKSAVIAVEISETLNSDLKTYLNHKVEAVNKPAVNFRFVQCKECFTVRAETSGENVIVKKGVQDRAEIAKLTSVLGVTSYTEVQAISKSSRVALTVNIYSAKDSSLLFGKTYETRLLQISKSGVRLSLSILQGYSFDNSALPLGAAFSVSERIYGIGEFGLGLVFSSKEESQSSYFSVGPRVDFNIPELFGSRPNWGAYHIYLRTGFGWYDTYRDITYGVGNKFDFGSFMHVLLEGIGGLEVIRGKKMPFTLFFGFGADLG